jgi:hypothetical protein
LVDSAQTQKIAIARDEHGTPVSFRFNAKR